MAPPPSPAPPPSLTPPPSLAPPLGPEARLGLPEPSSGVAVLGVEEESEEEGGGASATVLMDLTSGKMYRAELSSAFLLQILCSDTPPERTR